ncbi:MAG: hypothetical protein APR53_06910 [Methanoculleus sp. SDB]|nr:MAG: hypothetical protein APR53_06910 [Methanoculleus sp. SDB]
MAFLSDPILIINLILCILIVIVSYWSAVRIQSTIPLFIGTAFGFFGISHFMTIIGLREQFETFLIIIRTAAYVLATIGVFETGRSIIQRKHVELSLRENEEKYRALFEAEMDPVFVIDTKSTQFMEVNSAALKLYGFSRDEFLNLGIADISAEPEKSLQVLKEPQELKIPLRYHRKKDGTLFPVEITANSFILNERTTFVATIRDISERKRYEEALRRVNRKLTLLSKITRTDLENQIFILKGFLALLAEKADDREQSNYVANITSSVETMATSVEFTRNYQDLGEKPPVWQNVQQVFLLAISHLDMSSIHRDIRMDGIEIYADSHLEKALQAMVAFAIRKGGDVHKILFTSGGSGALSLIYEQDGEGIIEARKEEIFSPDYSRDRDLFMVREILDITGISIRETGTPDGGIRFEIIVPEELYRTRSGEG